MTNTAPGHRFIVVTGCNGVGKSTVAEALRERLGGTVFHYPAEFVQFRANVALDTEVAALPRLLYYLAATMHLSDLVRQRLVDGHVICDRYLESPTSLLIAESQTTEAEVERVSGPFVPYLRPPDLTLLLTATYEAACARIRARLPRRATRAEQLVLTSPEFFQRREATLRSQAARLGPVLELNTTRLKLGDMCTAALDLVTHTPLPARHG